MGPIPVLVLVLALSARFTSPASVQSSDVLGASRINIAAEIEA